MKTASCWRGVLAGWICLALLGCGRRSEPGANPATAAPEAQSAALVTMNELVRDYVTKTKVIPKSVDELVTSGYLPNLPAAPPGKKFVMQLQPMGYSVVLADE